MKILIALAPSSLSSGSMFSSKTISWQKETRLHHIKKRCWSTPMSQVCFITWETEDSQGHTCTCFLFVCFHYQVYSYVNLILINKKASFTTKINKPKNPAMKPSTWISNKKNTGWWFGAAFLRDQRGDMVLNKRGKVNNQQTIPALQNWLVL